MLEVIIGSRSRREILRLLFTPERPVLHLREMSRFAQLSPPALSRELNKLAAIGLVTITRSAAVTRYQATAEHPFFQPLCDLVRREYGIIDAITAALAGDSINAAWIIGDGLTRPTEPLEIRIQSDLPFREINKRLIPVGNSIGREIRFRVVPPEDAPDKRHREKWFALWQSEAKNNGH